MNKLLALLWVVCVPGISSCIDVDADCETICEKFIECGVYELTGYSVCEDRCQRAAVLEDCDEILHTYAECIEGRSCTYTGCVSEETDLEELCW